MNENLSADRLDFLRDLAIQHPDNVNLCGETLLALIDRVEAAEAAVQRVEALLTDAETVEAVIRSRYDRIWIDSVRLALDGGEQK